MSQKKKKQKEHRREVRRLRDKQKTYDITKNTNN